MQFGWKGRNPPEIQNRESKSENSFVTFTPSRPCSHPGCAALVAYGEGTRCPAHRRAAGEGARQRDRFRGTAAERGYDSGWQRARLAFLAQYPLCAGVLFPTVDWTTGLAQEFHVERARRREHGELLWLSRFFAAVSAPPLARAGGHEGAENCGQIPGRAHAATGQPSAFRFQPWDVARPATVVDHIVPHKGDYELMWAEWNWQPLTKKAHDRKTATEQARGQRTEDSGQWSERSTLNSQLSTTPEVFR